MIYLVHGSQVIPLAYNPFGNIIEYDYQGFEPVEGDGVIAVPVVEVSFSLLQQFEGETCNNAYLIDISTGRATTLVDPWLLVRADTGGLKCSRGQFLGWHHCFLARDVVSSTRAEELQAITRVVQYLHPHPGRVL